MKQFTLSLFFFVLCFSKISFGMEKLGYERVGNLKLPGSAFAMSQDGKYVLIGNPKDDSYDLEVINLRQMVDVFVNGGSCEKKVVGSFKSGLRISKVFFSEDGKKACVLCTQGGWLYRFADIKKYVIGEQTKEVREYMSMQDAFLKYNNSIFGTKEKPFFLEDGKYHLFLTEFGYHKDVYFIVSVGNEEEIYKKRIQNYGIKKSEAPLMAITHDFKYILISDFILKDNNYFSNVIVFMKLGKLKNKLGKTLLKRPIILSDVSINCQH